MCHFNFLDHYQMDPLLCVGNRKTIIFKVINDLTQKLNKNLKALFISFNLVYSSNLL
jgi:hypothetical protein